MYVPLLQRLLQTEGGCRRAIDLGCGRGEWLQIAREAGFDAVGVDLNAGMAQRALDHGASVEIGDALEFMRRQNAGSAGIITAFHLVEHLPVDYLINLIGECNRVLDDSGILIFETPNPENVSVGTWTFYLDPTHQKPLPPILLEFLVQQAGFESTAVMRINGAGMEEGAGAIEKAFHTMFESARDYACLAQKRFDSEPDRGFIAHYAAVNSQPSPADAASLKELIRTTERKVAPRHGEIPAHYSTLIDELSNTHRGGSSAALIAAHEAEIGRLHHHIVNSETAHAARVAALQDAAAETERLHHEMMETAAARAQTIAALQSDIASRDAQLAERDRDSAALTSQVAQLRQAAETALHRVIELERGVSAGHASTSWRVTAPMRGLKRGVDVILLAPRQTARASLDRTIRWASARPRTKAMLKHLVRLVPPVERRLIAYAEARGGHAAVQSQWMIEPDPVVLGEWEKLLKVPRRDRSR